MNIATTPCQTTPPVAPVVPTPNVMLVGDTTTYATMHGTPWDYDRRVPIIFWRRGMAPSDRTEAISTTDIMPTLAASLGLSIDTLTLDGHCLGQVAGIACPR